MNTDTSLPSNLPLLHVLSVVLITSLIMKGSGPEPHMAFVTLVSFSLEQFLSLSWTFMTFVVLKIMSKLFRSKSLGGEECHRNDAVLFLCTLTGGPRIEFVPLVKMSTLTTLSTDYRSVLQFSPL